MSAAPRPKRATASGADTPEGQGAAAQVNPTAASLLGFLHDGPATGWDLVAAADLVIGPFWSLTRSQVYRELSNMAERGLVAAGEPGPRDRRPYTITDAGRQAFAAWAAAGPGEGTIRVPLLLFVTLGRHIGSAVLGPVVVEQRRVHESNLVQYEALRADFAAGGDTDPYLISTLEYGIRVARATLEWLDGLPEEIVGRQEDDRQA